MLKRYIQIKHCPKVKKDQNSSIDITEGTDPPPALLYVDLVWGKQWYIFCKRNTCRRRKLKNAKNYKKFLIYFIADVFKI